MKILFAASEVTPFAKTGGLADVAAALPRALKEMGHDVRIIMPCYRSVDKGNFSVRKGRKSVEIPMDGGVKKGLLRWTDLYGMPVYLLENNEYFGRDQLYGTSGGDYPDNAQRFAFFCRGIMQLLKKMDFRPDVIHCNDWQTALIPLLLKTELANDPFYLKTSSVYTIHNLAYQGIFDKDTLLSMGFDWSFFTMDRLEYYGRINLMKGGIIFADHITTVSETYRNEIMTKEMGNGLEDLLRLRSKDLTGVVNGIDTEEWDPEHDREIARTYSASTLAGKGVNKKGLQKLLGLERNDLPLVGMVTRLASQKGVDLIEELLPRLEEAPLQLVILGNGDDRYMKMMQMLRERAPKNISANSGYQSELSHRIYAGSDMFLMPSRYEPCGLGQLIALRYGTVPVVRKTGGLADTVLDVAEHPKEGNGFSFSDYEPEALWGALVRALAAYEDKKEWKKIVRRGMARDSSWALPARRYEEIYRGIALRKGY